MPPFKGMPNKFLCIMDRTNWVGSELCGPNAAEELVLRAKGLLELEELGKDMEGW
jgi:hypothetical protein